MWIKCNPNPGRKEVPDCVVRAITLATHRTWLCVYDDLCNLGRSEYNMPSAGQAWGKHLYLLGAEPFLLPASCPQCVTIRDFARMYPRGVYVIGTGSHAVAVIDGNYYDSWDSGNEIPSFFWRLA